MKFTVLAHVYDLIQRADREPQRVQILARLFQKADQRTLEAAAHLTLGEIVNPQVADRLGIGPGTIRRALATITGCEEGEIDEAVRHSGDMSEVVAQLVKGHDRLMVASLWERVNRAVQGGEDRLKLLTELFSRTTPDGAKYLTRIMLNQMRIGVGLGTLTKALAKAFEVDAGQIEHLYAMTNDIGLAATRARQGAKALADAGLTLFHPYQFMNAHKVDDPEEVFARLRGKRILFEVKYDGARLQIHIKARPKPADIRLYSRRLNDDTDSLPDVVAALRQAWKGGDAVLEGEAVAFDSTYRKKQPFQAVLMRLGRKYDIAEKARELPLVLYLFDLLYDDGQDLMNVPQIERRARLAQRLRPADRVNMTESIESDQREEEEDFFRKAISAGHEGLMAKDPEAAYLPGRRTDLWMKIKPAFETLDVVVVGGIWGSGRRRGLLSSLIVAVRDKDEFKMVGKVGTGFSEDKLRELTSKLEPKIITAHGRNVEIEPEIVIEVDFQDIQKTSAYSAGYALRIPRFKRERSDKSTREADTLLRLRQIYKKSHGRSYSARRRAANGKA